MKFLTVILAYVLATCLFTILVEGCFAPTHGRYERVQIRMIEDDINIMQQDLLFIENKVKHNSRSGYLVNRRGELAKQLKIMKARLSELKTELSD